MAYTEAQKICAVWGNAGEAGRDAFVMIGGDEFQQYLLNRKWVYVNVTAPYHFTMLAPDGSQLEYIEGDLYIRETIGSHNE